MSSSKLKPGASALVSAVLGLVIYFLVLAISHTNQHTFDLTENKRHTLSEQSKEIVRQLTEPVKVWAFEATDEARKKTTEVLERYQRENPDMFHFEVVDPERSPTLAQEFEVRTTGQAVLEFEKPATEGEEGPGRRERAATISENDLTNALLKLTRTKELKLVFLQGHGERSLDAQEQDGLSNWKAALAQEGYTFETLNLAEGKDIPQDAAVVILAGPTTALLPGEKEKLAAYLANEGRLLLLAEVETPQSYNELLEPYGMTLTDEVIIDEGSQLFGAQPVYAVGMVYSTTHPITSKFPINTVFLLARPVTAGKAPEGAEVEPVIQTGPTAFGVPIKDVLGQRELRFDINKVEPETLPVAVAGRYPSQEPAPAPKEGEQAEKNWGTRVLLVGDTEAFTNQMLGLAGNRDLALNMMNWLSESEELISIRASDEAAKPLMLEAAQARWMMLVLVLFIPLAVGVTGVVTSLRRRSGH